MINKTNMTKEQEENFLECPACKCRSAVKRPVHLETGSLWVRKCELCGYVTQLHIKPVSEGVQLTRYYDSKPNSFPISPQPTTEPLVIQRKVVGEVEEGEDGMVLKFGDEGSKYILAKVFQNDAIGIMPDYTKISEEEAKKIIDSRKKQRKGFMLN